MLNSHAKAQAVSLSPILGRTSHADEKPLKTHSRATFAHASGIDKDTATRAPRIEKGATLPRKRYRNSGPGLAQRFDGTINLCCC